VLCNHHLALSFFFDCLLLSKELNNCGGNENRDLRMCQRCRALHQLHNCGLDTKTHTAKRRFKPHGWLREGAETGSRLAVKSYQSHTCRESNEISGVRDLVVVGGLC